MSPVFSHGQLRLYLLKLLDDGPKSGYDIIRDLEEQFGGTYRPSAGTVYPRLAKLEAEGLVTRTVDGRRTIYALTDAGRDELAARTDDLEDVEQDVTETVRDLADAVRREVSDAMRTLRADLASSAREQRRYGKREHHTTDAPVGEGATGFRENSRQSSPGAAAPTARDIDAVLTQFTGRARTRMTALLARRELSRLKLDRFEQALRDAIDELERAA